MAIEFSRHLIATNKFSCHWMASYDFGRHLMATNKFGCHWTTTYDFGCHLMATNKFHHHRTTSYDFGCHWWIRSIFRRHLGTVKWRLNYCSTIQCQPIFKKVFKGMWILKCNFWFIFEHLFFHLGFVSLVAHLQPLCGTLGELRWSSPWWRATFFTFCKIFGTP